MTGGKVARVRVDMGQPRLQAGEIPVALPGVAPHERVVDFPLNKYLAGWHHEAWHDVVGLEPGMTCVSMGNPHLVLFCRDVADVPLTTVGPRLERAAEFPKRINVHFVQVHGPDEVTVRTWERGSGITLACGTGASAVCVAGVLGGQTGRQIVAHLPGGDLELEWNDRRSCVYDRAGRGSFFGQLARRRVRADPKTDGDCPNFAKGTVQILRSLRSKMRLSPSTPRGRDAKWECLLLRGGFRIGTKQPGN